MRWLSKFDWMRTIHDETKGLIRILSQEGEKVEEVEKRGKGIPDSREIYSLHPT